MVRALGISFVVALAAGLGVVGSSSASQAESGSFSRACDVPDWRPEYVSLRSAEPAADRGEIDDPGVAWLTDPAAQDQIRGIWADLEQRRIPTLGGYVDLLNQKLVVVAEPGAEETAQASADSIAKMIAVEIHTGCSDRNQLEESLTRIEQDAEEGRFVSESLSAYIDARLGVVVVEVGPETRLIAEAVSGAYRDLPVVLSRTGAPEPLVRCGDAASHYGGALYRQGSSNNCSASLGICTTGFKVKRNSDGKIGMSTAGHCRANTGWSGDLYSKTQFMGEFYNWSYNATAYDDWGFMTDSTYSRTIYTDPCCPSTRAVSGTSTTYVGDSLCLSGGVTTARCSMIVEVLTVLNCDIFGNCAKNTKATRSSGGTACQNGDSGAPWYKGGSNNTAKIYGIQSFGTSAGGPTCYFNPVFRMVSDGYTVMTT